MSAPRPSLPAAVLFDMDGTLVDTEPYWIAAEFDLVAEFGGAWDESHAHALVGSALTTSAEYLRDVGGVALEPPVIIDRLMDVVIADTERLTPWRPGAVELLASCGAAGIPCALVTMSYRRLAEAVVRGLPAGSFTTIVAGDDVVHGKPDPEAYLAACARLDVAPAQSVALEDSPTGVRSALAAGCAVVGIPHQVPIPPAPELVLVDSLASVTLDWLGTLVR